MSNSAKSTSFRAAAKGPKVKARLMYGYIDAHGANLKWPEDMQVPAPFVVLPADEAAYEAMLEQMGIALYKATYPKLPWKGHITGWYFAAARVTLASIGIKRPKGSK